MSELSSVSGSKTFLTSGSSSPNLPRILLNCETAKRVSPSPAFIHCTRVAERVVRCRTLISFLSSCSLSISISSVSVFDGRLRLPWQALLLRLEFFAQQLFRPVQPPLDGRQRQVQKVRDPFQRHLVVKTQFQNQTVVFIERVYSRANPGFFKRVAGGERARERLAVLNQRFVQIDSLAALLP